MNNEQFISVIKRVVRDSAIEDTIENLEDPPGRIKVESEQQRSEWFNGLSDDSRKKVESIIADSVDEALFGFLAVIDGVRTIENDEVGSSLILIHKSKTEELLNDPNKIGLHDLYNAAT